MPVPIPKRPSGYRLGNPGAPVSVEMFFDLECPFSKRGWLTLMQVMERYPSDQLCAVLQPMVLSNHRQSWDATMAAITVSKDDPNAFVRFVSYLFDHQKEFANDAFDHKTRVELQQLLAHYAVDAAGWDSPESFIERLNSEEIYSPARIPARFAAVRGVWSTPTFFINGAEASDLSSKSSVKDWQQVIDSLL